MNLFRRLFWVALVVIAAPFLHADDTDWIKAAAKIPTPTFDLDPPAVVLLDETTVEVSETGDTVETCRVVIRILHSSGAKRAEAALWYNGENDKILKANAWILRKVPGGSKEPGGSFVKDKSRRDWVDESTATYLTTADEMRKLSISLSAEAVPGDIFAYETRVRGPSLVALQRWRFGSELPTVSTRVSVNVPAGFSVVPRLFGKNQPDSNRSTDGRTMTWTLGSTPYRPHEPSALESALTDAELFVQVVPPASATGFAPKSFSSWGEVAAWVEKLNDGTCDTSPALTAKVQELTAECPDALAKIRALGRYVQSTRYVANNLDLGRGAGYVSRKASLVLARDFGDCKDKANLLKAMLREVGIKSYMAYALVQTSRRVHPEVPSPTQFNHAILCIEAPDGAPPQATVEVPALGKLLIFDPTDKHTVVGDLPEPLQGTKIALGTRSVETLVDVPVISPELGFKVQRKATIELAADGSAVVEAQIQSHGHLGMLARRALEGATTPASLETFFRTDLSDSFRGAVFLSKKSDDDRLTGRFTKTLSCENKRFAQRMQGMTMVKLEVFSRDNLPSFAQKERRLPIKLGSRSVDDEIVLKIPAGLKVEELPEKAAIESAYGTYSLTLRIVENTVVLNRRLTLHRAELPVEDYPKIRQFLNDVARADRCALILR